MNKLLKYMKTYKKEAILGPLFKFLEASFELIVPLVVAKIVDEGINGGKGMPFILQMFLILIALGVIGFISSIVAQYFCAKAAVGFSAKLRYELFDNIQKLSYSEIDKLGTSTMITRMTSDINQVQNGVNMFLRLFLRSPFVVIGAFVMACIVSLKSSIIFGIVIILLSLIVFIIMHITQPLNKKVQSNVDDVLQTTRENMQGVRVIRAFVKEEDEKAKFNKKLSILNKSQKVVGNISALMNPLTYAVVNMGIIAILYYGGKQVEGGSLIQGDVLALYNYMSQILVELVKLANLIVLISKALASASRVSNVLDMKSTLEFNDNKKQDSKAFIEFDNVSLQYKNSSGNALSNISFTVERGETIGIIGGTGSGKTSLVNMIPHFYDSTKGSVYIEGNDVKSLDSIKLRERIGLVPQKAVLFKGTIRENMQWAKKDAIDEQINKALEIAQAKDVVNSKGGLNANVEQNGQNFSGGQRQRLTIARALVNNPEILILDDSASALDYLTDLNLRKAIKNLENVPTTFIVSQRTSSIMHADKIIVLDDGKIVGIGKHKDLLKNCEVYKEIYNSQFKKEV